MFGAGQDRDGKPLSLEGEPEDAAAAAEPSVSIWADPGRATLVKRAGLAVAGGLSLLLALAGAMSAYEHEWWAAGAAGGLALFCLWILFAGWPVRR